MKTTSPLAHAAVDKILTAGNRQEIPQRKDQLVGGVPIHRGVIHPNWCEADFVYKLWSGKCRTLEANMSADVSTTFPSRHSFV